MMRENYHNLIALYLFTFMFSYAYANGVANADADKQAVIDAEEELISKERELIEHIKKKHNYGSNTLLPVKEHDKAIDVSFMLTLHRILSIDEQEEKITVQASKKLVWMNEKITWDPKEWGNITRIVVHHKNIWAPDLTLLSNAERDAPKPHSATDYVDVYYTGKNIWRPVVTLSTIFRMDIEYFPFDLQTFEMKFSSWVLNASKLRLVDSTDDLVKDGFHSAEWRLVKAENIINKAHIGGEYIYEVKFIYELVRKSWYYVVTLIVPCFILIFIQLFSYFLPAKSGERMGVIITVLLVFAVFLEAIRTRLPQNADATSVLAEFYLMSMIVSTVSFLSNCIVVSLLQEKRKLPPWFIRRYIIKTLDASNSECVPLTSEIKVRSSDDIWFQKLIDEKQLGLENLSIHTNEEKAIVCKMEVIENLLALIAGRIEKEREAREIIKEEIEKQKQINEEWETFAVKMDIMCFYIFSLLFLLTSLVILMPAYYQYKDYHSIVTDDH